MNIKDQYMPYNFSKTRCFVITLLITPSGIEKVEQKLPKQIKVLKGIYVSTTANADEMLVGRINLWFNEGITKTISLPVMNTKGLTDRSHPLPLNEEMKPNSTMQGIYFGRDTIRSFPYTVKIYLHYEESL
jgi:hypothetical protein